MYQLKFYIDLHCLFSRIYFLINKLIHYDTSNEN